MGQGIEPLLELREVGFGLMAAVMQIVPAGNEAQIGMTKDLLNETRKKLYRLLAEDEDESARPSD